MNKYELAVVVSAKIEDEERAAVVDKCKALIERFGGTITNVDDWGKKRLAYEIQKMKEGFYYFIQFEAESSAPAEIESRIRIMDNVLRYLVVRKRVNMNKVILMGRLTRDPEVRYSQGDNAMAIARYTLAVDRRFNRNNNDENSADFIGCVAFGKSAEFAERYLHKGTKIVATGRIQTGSYVNKDGVKVYTTDVVVEDQEFAESKNSAASNDGGYNGGGYNSAPARPQPAAATDGFMNIPDGIDEELPFN